MSWERKKYAKMSSADLLFLPTATDDILPKETEINMLHFTWSEIDDIFNGFLVKKDGKFKVKRSKSFVEKSSNSQIFLQENDQMSFIQVEHSLLPWFAQIGVFNWSKKTCNRIPRKNVIALGVQKTNFRKFFCKMLPVCCWLQFSAI